MKTLRIVLSLLACMYISTGKITANTLQHDAYFKERMEELTAIHNSLDNAQQQKILEIFKSIEGNDLKKNYVIAVSRVIDAPDQIYTVHQKEIDLMKGSKLEETSKWYITKYELSASQIKSIKSLLTERTKEGLIGAYLYPEYMSKKMQFQKESRDKYAKPIMIALTYEGAKTEIVPYCTALNYSADLQLSVDQKNKIIDRAWDIWNNKNQDSPKSEENRQLSKILSNDQYENYLKLQAGARAMIEANRVWTTALDLGINKESEKNNMFDDLLDYYTKRIVIQDKYKVSDNQSQLKKNLSEFDLANKPLLLIKIYTVQNLSTDQLKVSDGMKKKGINFILPYASVLKYTDELELNQVQVNQVIANAWKLVVEQKQGQKVSKNQETISDKSVLTKDQHEKYLSLQANGKAEIDADRVWRKAIALNVSAESEKDILFPELLDYYSKRIAIQVKHKTTNDDTQLNQELADFDLANKPLLLMKIYVAETSKGTNQTEKRTKRSSTPERLIPPYCSILEHAKELALSPEQTDLIIENGWQLMLNSKRGITVSHKDEHKSVKEILNAEQYENYLTLKAANRAENEAERVWAKALDLEINIDLDKDSVYPELFTYYQKRIVIQDRYSIIQDSYVERENRLEEYDKRNKPSLLKMIYAKQKMLQKNDQEDMNSLKW